MHCSACEQQGSAGVLLLACPRLRRRLLFDPLYPEERRFHCARYKKDIIIFLRAGQGAKASSLTWAHMDALITRLTQSLYKQDETALETYTDDPLLALLGTDEAHNDELAALAMAT